MYREITDVHNIETSQKELSKKLNHELRVTKHRVIGYPSGYFEADVRFAAKTGTDVLWWYGSLSENGEAFVNFFGHGNPQDTKTLYIDLQFNFPRREFDRRHGGVFVEETGSGSVLLAHRGIVTRGKSRVKKSLLLEEADVSAQEVYSDLAPGVTEVLLVAPIGDNSLSNKIEDFSLEMRRAASAVMGGNNAENNSSGKKLGSMKSNLFDSALREYFDEFIGKAKFNGKRNGNMDCRHGAIVKSLRKTVDGYGEIKKSGAIDLAVIKPNQIWLFEVKTGANTQSIYTGIGQLYIHGAVLSRKFAGKKIKKYLVIPASPLDKDRVRMRDELGINVVTFSQNGENYRFTNI